MSALTFGYLGSGSQSLKPAKLCLTPNQLYYLLSRFDELGVAVGPMNIRLENIHAVSSSANYVSFLTKVPRSRGKISDQDSIHSVSSVRSVMSSVSSIWSGYNFSSMSTHKVEKQKALILEDLRYLYSAFTKIPCLKLANDYRVPRIAGFEEFPFDTAVPVHVFRNLHTLEIIDVDFRTFFGWDRVADHVRFLTLKRAALDDPVDLLTNIVLDDMDKRRRRSARSASSPIATSNPIKPSTDLAKSLSESSSPPPISRTSLGEITQATGSHPAGRPANRDRLRSPSPPRPTTSHQVSTRRNHKLRRSSASSTSSGTAYTPRNSSSNLLAMGFLPSTKWHFLKHLCLSDNGLTSISATSLAPIVTTLQSLDLSSNLFTEVPDSLASLMSLRALNLSDCLIDSLRSLARAPLPAITTLNLRGNKLTSLAGIEKLLSLERLDLRDNKLTDPTELSRLTGMPDFSEVFVLRNAFVKTHPGYRVKIFNVFRSTPGYTQDVMIDATAPGYSERQQLVDRAPERANVPVVRPVTEDEIVVTSAKRNDHDDYFSQTHSEPRLDAEAPQGQITPLIYQSQRRKKGPRRRIVDISQAEFSRPETPAVAVTSIQEGPAKKVHTSTEDENPLRQSWPASGACDDASHTSSITLYTAMPSSTAIETTPHHRASDMGQVYAEAATNTYRKKIEALKINYGDSWLSNIDGPHNSTAIVDQSTYHEKKGLLPAVVPTRSNTSASVVTLPVRKLGSATVHHP